MRGPQCRLEANGQSKVAERLKRGYFKGQIVGCHEMQIWVLLTGCCSCVEHTFVHTMQRPWAQRRKLRIVAMLVVVHLCFALSAVPYK